MFKAWFLIRKVFLDWINLLMSDSKYCVLTKNTSTDRKKLPNKESMHRGWVVGNKNSLKRINVEL